jgi:hypothetical protein
MDASKMPRFLRRYMEPALLNYLVLTAAGLLIYFLAMASKGNTIGAILAVVLAIPGVLARWVISPTLVLLLTVYMLYDPGFFGVINFIGTGRWQVFPDGPGFDLMNAVLAASLLAYFIGHYRLNALLHAGIANDPTPRRPLHLVQRATRPVATVPPDELPKVLVAAAACLLGGQLLWYVLAGLERLSRPHAYNAGTTRLMLFGWLLGGGLLLLSVLLSYWRHATMTRHEADMILRDTAFHEMRRETDRLQRWRRWFKDRVALRRTTK